MNDVTEQHLSTEITVGSIYRHGRQFEDDMHMVLVFGVRVRRSVICRGWDEVGKVSHRAVEHFTKLR